MNLALVWSSVCGFKIEPSDINDDAIEDIKNDFDIYSLNTESKFIHDLIEAMLLD